MARMGHRVKSKHFIGMTSGISLNGIDVYRLKVTPSTSQFPSRIIGSGTKSSLDNM